MKFSELKIGKAFKYNGELLIKVSNTETKTIVGNLYPPIVEN